MITRPNRLLRLAEVAFTLTASAACGDKKEDNSSNNPPREGLTLNASLALNLSVANSYSESGPSHFALDGITPF